MAKTSQHSDKRAAQPQPKADAPLETRELEYGKGGQAKKSKGGDKEPFAPLPRRSLFA